MGKDRKGCLGPDQPQLPSNCGQEESGAVREDASNCFLFVGLLFVWCVLFCFVLLFAAGFSLVMPSIVMIEMIIFPAPLPNSHRSSAFPVPAGN